jgi:hypothetical protein
MATQANIQFTEHMVEELREEYNKAVEAGAETFFYGGNQYVTDYAKYLLQYIDQTCNWRDR